MASKVDKEAGGGAGAPKGLADDLGWCPFVPLVSSRRSWNEFELASNRAPAPPRPVSSPLPAAAFGGPSAIDPFAAGSKGVGKIHLRVQQRNGRKCITTVQGLDEDLDMKRICKAMKRDFNCNGSIEENKVRPLPRAGGAARRRDAIWLMAGAIAASGRAATRSARERLIRRVAHYLT